MEVKEPSAKYLARPRSKRTDVGLIPEHWIVRRVGEMGDVRAGKALAVRGAGQQRSYLRTKNVFDGRIDLEDVLQMPMTDSEFARYELRHGDVLLNEGQSVELVGRCAMYRDELSGPCAIQNQLVRFRAREGVSASYATHLFRYCQKTGVFSKIALQTTSVAHLGVSRFERLLLAWPSRLGEQEAIAEALSDADAFIESLEKLLAKKRQIKQGAMQELLTGKKRLPGFSGKWKPMTLGEMGKCHRGVSYQPNRDLSPFDTDSSVRLLRSNNVQEAKVVLVDVQYVNSARVSEDQCLRIGDILICMANGSRDLVGKAGRFVTDDGFDYTFGAFMGCYRPNTTIADPDFLFYLFHTEAYRRHIAILLAGSSINNLTPNSVEALAIPVPLDRQEQAAVARLLSEIDGEIDGLEAKLAKTRTIKQGMMQQLLTGRIRLL